MDVTRPLRDRLLALSYHASLLFSTATALAWRQYGPWAFFHGSLLMTAWSGVFLWFMGSDRRPDPEQADRAPRQTRGDSPKGVARPWRPDDRVGLQERKRVSSCLVRDIAYIRAAGEYTEVHLSSGQVAMVRQRLLYRESQVPESFVRIHRSTLINLELAEDLVHVDGAWRVRLYGCEEPLTVSRRLEQAVRAKLVGRKGRVSM